MYSKKQPASPAAIRRSLYAASFTFSSFLVSFITPSFLSSLSRYAKKWYDEHIKNENTFLYMYFAEPDTDNDVGYMAYVNGKQVSSVMDSEAIEIFWAYVDKYWYSDMSTDDMFTTIFTKTADRIMTKSTTAADVGNNAVKVIGVIVVFAGIIIVMVVRRKHKAEEAKETEKILNTPLDGDSEADDLLKKYKKGD